MRASPQALTQAAKVGCFGSANMLPPVTSSSGFSDVITITTSGMR